MISSVLKNIFGSSNERYLKSLNPIIDEINSLEPEIGKLSDKQIKEKTGELKERVEKGASLDEILPEAFAAVREAAKRTLGQRHYDVQLIGGIVLHQGKIAEMKTGEGKTLVATLAAYLNALSGKGVHVVTVNDYLAKRDAGWMAKVYEFLGLSVGVILHGQNGEEKKAAYAADITYGTNNEYGFDYLRDNMCFELEEMVQRPFNFAIIDEVDSILIDEARTPLIISGPVEDRTDLYVRINNFIPKLAETDYEKDEKANSVVLTDEGVQKLEDLFTEAGVIEEGSSLFDIANMTVLHHTNQALKAHQLFNKDKEYLIRDNKVCIIDEFTGRVMEGRRFSDGLHQALEAKEGVAIQNENQTLASITFQNFFRMYPKLSGMTGTAMTEASEFDEIYKLQVVEIPTNAPIAREDAEDNIYRTEEEKFAAITRLIRESVEKKQPVLAGTASLEKSELLSKFLKKEGIKHNILNAKNHAKEATIIVQAGQPGAVTVATNMAGRGTDIQLGGNAELMIAEKAEKAKDEKEIKKIADKINAKVAEDKKTVLEAGGLCVIGTERHESRRIDNQLRGRSGRQGDPGYTKFFLSAQDDLIRVFGADKKMDWVLGKMGEEGEPIEHPMITRMMEKAQAKVEARNFEIRKNLLKFDDVMNDQRKVIYDQRIKIMKATEIREKRAEVIDEVVDNLVSAYIPKGSYREKWEVSSLKTEVLRVFSLDLPIDEWADEEGVTEQEIFERIANTAEKFLDERDEKFDVEAMQNLERRIYIFVLDQIWKDHLHFLDQLRQGINLRAYGQKDPLNEYKKEAFEAFRAMLVKLNEVFMTRLFNLHVQVDEDDEVSSALQAQSRSGNMSEGRFDPAGETMSSHNPSKGRKPQVTIRSHVKAEDRDPNDPETWGKIARNEACPCGSGKKYKQCHGKLV